MTFTHATDDQLMAIAMHRYCLSRSSYIVGSGIAVLTACWAQLTPQTQQIIVRDTREELGSKIRLWHDCDKRAWQAFVDAQTAKEGG